MAAEAADQPEIAEVSVFEARDRGHGAAPVVVRGPGDGSVGDVSWRQIELFSAKDRVTLGAPTAAFVGALLGCLATLYLIAFGIVPEIASALAATLLCSQVLIPRTIRSLPREFFPAVYGGTFGGMTPVLWLSDNASHRPALFISLSIVCALTFYVVAKIDTRLDAHGDPRPGGRLGFGFALGYGGRSGAIATMASLLFVELASLFGADDGPFRAARADILDVELSSAALTCAACAIGMSATLLALRRGRVASAETADKTFIASSLALIGLVTLHLMSPNGVRILDAFYAGCFLGMSTPERLKGWVEALLGAVVLTALLLQIRILLPGIGGSLGFAAFATVAALAAARRMTGWTTREVPARDVPLAACLAIGCVALAYQRMPDQPPSNRAATALVAEQSAPATGQLALAQNKPSIYKPGTFEDAIPPGLPADNDDPGIGTALPREASVMDRGLPESGELPVPGQQALDTAVRPAAAADPAKTVMGATSEGATPLTAEPARSAAADDHVVDPHSREQMFREFLQWRAARSATIARAERQPAKRSRNPSSQVLRPLVPVGSPASLHQVSARRSARNAAANPALGQSVLGQSVLGQSVR
jgi:hypothetical protein